MRRQDALRDNFMFEEAISPSSTTVFNARRSAGQPHTSASRFRAAGEVRSCPE